MWYTDAYCALHQDISSTIKRGNYFTPIDNVIKKPKQKSKEAPADESTCSKHVPHSTEIY